MNVPGTFLQFGLELLSMFLPSAVNMNPEFGVDIASDWNKLEPARNYWKGQFDGLQKNASFTWSPQPDWLEFTVQASSVNYIPWVRQRNAIRKAQEFNAIYSKRSGPVLRNLDALISAAEIAKFIGESSSPPIDNLTQSSLLSHVAAVFNINKQTAPPADSDQARHLGMGLRAARELNDAGWRFEFARQHAQLLSPPVTFAELLALHRAEGAFCMFPAEKSLEYAPLILTDFKSPGQPTSSDQPSPARTSSVTFTPGKDIKPDQKIIVTRAGFVPAINRPGLDKKVQDLLVILVTLLTLGGLDNLVSWPITYDDEKNELALLLDKAIRENVGSIFSELDPWSRALHDSDVPALVRIVQGLAMARLEADPTLDGNKLIAQVITDLRELRVYKPSEDLTSFSILDDDKRTHTKKCLEVASRWYASRSRPETLLAWRDRAGFTDMPRLSPYMTYLRFHSGDVLFVGILLRATSHLADMHEQWGKAMRKVSFAGAIHSLPGADFAASLGNSGFHRLISSEKRAISIALDLWKKDSTKYVEGEGESVWRHVGLLDIIDPPWMPPSTRERSTAHIIELADAILGAMTVIRDRGLLEPISLAIQYLPVSYLFAVEDFRNRKYWSSNLRVTENFERLRLFIDQARGDKFDEKGVRIA